MESVLALYQSGVHRFDGSLQSRRVPLAVSVIDMDWHKTAIPARFGSGWTGYSWNRDLIPDPAAFLNSLHERGLKVTLNVHPADGIRAFEDAYPMVAKRLGLDAEKKKQLALTFIVQPFAKLISKMSTIPWKIKEWTFGGLIGNKVVMARWIPFGC